MCITIFASIDTNVLFLIPDLYIPWYSHNISSHKVDLLLWFGLVYLFIHSVTHVTLDTSITDYNLYITTQPII